MVDMRMVCWCARMKTRENRAKVLENYAIDHGSEAAEEFKKAVIIEYSRWSALDDFQKEIELNRVRMSALTDLHSDSLDNKSQDSIDGEAA